MLTRRKLLLDGLRATAAASSVLHFGGAHAVSAVEDNDVTGKRSLQAHARAHGLFAGTAVTINVLNTDPVYRRIVAEQYDMVVAEWEMKWKPLRPAPDKFSFELADALLAFAAQNEMKVRGHNFVWHEALPDWFASTVTKENARKFLVDHIMTVGGRYRGRIHSWDVVNEAVLPRDGRADGLRNSRWMQLLGPDYIDIAFRTAREADPHALLTYNDYGIEYDNQEDDEKRGAMLQLLRRMKAANVPLDAVGIQSHIKAASAHSIGKGLLDFMASVRQMGLQIYITELDVNEDDVATNDVAERDRIIAETYRPFLSAVLSEPSVKAVLTWGVSDNHTWLNSTASHKKKQPNRSQRALPFDAQYHPKECFFALRDSFDRKT